MEFLIGPLLVLAVPVIAVALVTGTLTLFGRLLRTPPPPPTRRSPPPWTDDDEIAARFHH